ncbi:MAG: fatty acid CoA ligase family protein, partial [Thermoplasmata archaeon]
MVTSNLTELLKEAVKRKPYKRAVVCPVSRDFKGRVTYSHLTFQQLEEESDRYAWGLEKAGIKKGTKTILMIRPSLEFFNLTFALIKIGAVPVMIDPGMGYLKMVKSLETVGAEAFIGIPAAHLLRVAFPDSFKSVKIAVTVGRRLFWGGLTLKDIYSDVRDPYPYAKMKPDEMAAIFFTTGSTGPPKGTVYEHGMLDAQVEFLRGHFGYGEDDIDLATFPLFSLFDTALGMTSVIPDMDPTRPGFADPKKLVEAIHNQGCTNMFGSPALLANLARYGEETGVKLPSLKRVITAGAPVRPEMLMSFKKMLPEGAVIHTPYGATEVLPVSDISSETILTETWEKTMQGGGTCVGLPLPGITVEIIEITDEPIPEWKDVKILPPYEIGEITVKGPNVTKEYYNLPEHTRKAKIYDGNTVWHRMGDVGYKDEKGRLWFCGRKSHRVVAKDRTYFAIPTEAIFNRHPRVLRTAIVGVGNKGEQIPVLCVELKPSERIRDEEDRKKLIEELKQLGSTDERTKNISH